MRILQVTPGYYPTVGGVERHVHGLCTALVARGHAVTVATLAAPGGGPGTKVVDGVTVHSFPALGPPAYRVPIGLGRYLRRAAPGFDAIHAHNAHALPLWRAAAACGPRCVISPYYHQRAHSWLAGLLHRVYDPLTRPALLRAGSVVCLSAADAREAARRLGLRPPCIVVIPSGIAAATGPSHGAAGGDPVLLCVGRLEAYKRVDRVIAALAGLPAAWTLVVVGSGPARAPVEALAVCLGVRDRVRFLGQVSDAELAAWYGRARVAITLSEAESFGLTVLEAVAAGCPLVCSAIPAYREFQAAFPQYVSLVSGDSVPQVAAAVQAAAVGAPARAPDLRRYAWPAIAGALIAEYTRVGAVARQAPRPAVRIWRGGAHP